MRKNLWVGISAVEKGSLSAWCYGEKPARAELVFLGAIFALGGERCLSSKSVQVPSVAPTMKRVRFYFIEKR